MLILAKRIHDFSFAKLMEVYTESCRENGAEFWPWETPERQLALVEQDFYDYLVRCFFTADGAVYAIRTEGERYVSALRLEPYRDGLLLEALETAPEFRRKGYARDLICAVLAEYSGVKIYAHVSKRNMASLRTHEVCGFQRVLEYAAYIDGSVNERCCTLCYES